MATLQDLLGMLAPQNASAPPPNRSIGESPGGIGLEFASMLPGALRGMLGIPQQAFQASNAMQQGYGYDPGPMLSAALLPMGGGFAAPVRMGTGEVALGAGPIRLFHGSPHDFDKFDMTKIGTGEGAQSYGYGLYGAENPATAESYRTAVMPHDLQGSELHAASAMRFKAGDRDAAIQHLMMQERMADNPGYYADAANLLRSGWKPPGRMYEISVNADPEHFLDWDKPLSEQSEHVKSASNPDFIAQHGAKTPQQAYPYGINAETAKSLRDAGIPGIKYLDQGSRRMSDAEIQREIAASEGQIAKLQNDRGIPAADALIDTHRDRISSLTSKLGQPQTRNYVLFRDDIISILRKYGLAGMTALPPSVSALMGLQQQPKSP